jgi:hypothetical protein
MTGHACPRCGYEPRCAKWRTWADRHPVAAVQFALPAGYTIIGVILDSAVERVANACRQQGGRSSSERSAGGRRRSRCG